MGFAVSRSNPGKEETFRCRWGVVYLYVPGKKSTRPHARQMKQYAIKILADHILVTNSADFQATRGLVFQQWNDIAKACAKSGLKKVLIHGVGFERKLNTAEMFRTGDAFPGLGLLGMRVALCFPGYKTDELSGFFRTVADNRGVELCFFGELEAAAEWLGIASSKQQTTRMTPA